MQNSFRLKSDGMFSRSEEENQEEQLRIVFLSVEGNKTERQYFDLIEKYRSCLKIKKAVHIHPLKRAKDDNNSAPEQVLELLEEYVELRDPQKLPKRLMDAVSQKYSYEFVKQYLNKELERTKDVEDFELLLEEAGIDLAYNLFLQDYTGNDDIFGIVLDRDYKNHSVEQMKRIVDECRNNEYRCFISTPLFEFWLLLHLVDVKSEYSKNMREIMLNEKVSDKHTYTSKLVSEIAGHAKGISEAVFRKFYLNKVDYAITQANSNFATGLDDLIGNDTSDDSRCGKIGTNMPELFKLLREV